MNLPNGLGDGGGARGAYVSLVRLLTAASPMASIIHASGDMLGAALVAPVLEWRDGHLMLGFSEGDAPERVSQALIGRLQRLDALRGQRPVGLDLRASIGMLMAVHPSSVLSCDGVVATASQLGDG